MHNKRIGKNISIIYRYSQIFLNPVLKKFNLGSGQYILLAELFDNNGINQEQLTNLVKIDKANTARGIKKLVEEGYVTKVICAEDKRAYKLYTTEKAEAIKPNLQSIFDSWNDVILNGISEAEADQLLLMLDRIEQNISQHFENS